MRLLTAAACLRRLSGGLTIAFNQPGKYHQPLGRRANGIRGITGNQRELGIVWSAWITLMSSGITIFLPVTA